MKKTIALILSFALLLCGCASGEKSAKTENEKNTEKEVLLGIILPMSDHEMIYGIQLAVNEINLSGGINGSPVSATFFNYENGNIYGTEGAESLSYPIFINLSGMPMYEQLKDFSPALLTFSGNHPGETYFGFSGFNSKGFENIFTGKYSTKPNYTTAKAYEMIYIAKQLIEISNSESTEDLISALRNYGDFKGRFHSSVTARYNPF